MVFGELEEGGPWSLGLGPGPIGLGPGPIGSGPWANGPWSWAPWVGGLGVRVGRGK